MGALTVKLHDLATNELADISAIAFEPTWTRLHNGATQFALNSIANRDEFTAVAGDGLRNLRKGNRKLIVWEDGHATDPIFHGRIHGVERTGDGSLATPVKITAFSPVAELGYASQDRAGRVVRGSTVAGGTYDGNFISPKFVSSVDAGAAISGPDLIQQILTNSANTGDESDPSPGEGPLTIDLTTGTFDLDVPPAVDLSPQLILDWPVMVGDFIQTLVQTGVVDILERPVDPTEGLDGLIMVALSAVSSLGTDKSGTVHFDYLTGDNNALTARHIEDFSAICNKLYDYLGPRSGPNPNRWAGNITPGSPGATVDPSASRTLYAGQFFMFRPYDSIGDENSARPLYLALWNGEQGYRVEPRDLLYITPNPDAKALFVPPWDFDCGDLIMINTGPEFGIELAEAQRVYGYTKTWSREGVASVSELLTSADVS